MRTVYRNGVVHVSGPVAPAAFVVEDGRIAWLGADADAPEADEVVDLEGALVAPGFVDAHAQVVETGLAVSGVDLSAAVSLEQALDLLAVAAASGGTVVAHGWDETRWPEERPPSPAEVSRAVRGQPACVVRADLERAVLSDPMVDTAGCRDLPGWADGVVSGEALERVRLSLRSDERSRSSLLSAGLAEFARNGVVSVHEHSAPGLDTRAGLAELLGATASAASGLPEVVGYRAELCEHAGDARGVAEEIPGLAGLGAPPVDGAITSRSAALRSPYADADPPACGELRVTAEQIANHVGAATRAGLQAVLQAEGDRAMAEVLLGIQAASEVEGVEDIRAAGHRLERAAMVDAPALARILLLGLTVCGQPMMDARWGGSQGMLARRLGSVRGADLHAFADLVGAGVPVALGSGSPAGHVDPWGAVRAAALHHEPSQRLPLVAAFRAHTEAGHRAARSTESGVLRIGGPATFAVWRAAALVAEGRSGALDGAPGARLLPDLTVLDAMPTCVRTVRDGVVLFSETD